MLSLLNAPKVKGELYCCSGGESRVVEFRVIKGLRANVPFLIYRFGQNRTFGRMIIKEKSTNPESPMSEPQSEFNVI